MNCVHGRAGLTGDDQLSAWLSVIAAYPPLARVLGLVPIAAAEISRASIPTLAHTRS